MLVNQSHDWNLTYELYNCQIKSGGNTHIDTKLQVMMNFSVYDLSMYIYNVLGVFSHFD